MTVTNVWQELQTKNTHLEPLKKFSIRKELTGVISKILHRNQWTQPNSVHQGAEHLRKTKHNSLAPSNTNTMLCILSKQYNLHFYEIFFFFLNGNYICWEKCSGWGTWIPRQCTISRLMFTQIQLAVIDRNTKKPSGEKLLLSAHFTELWERRFSSVFIFFLSVVFFVMIFAVGGSPGSHHR